MSIKQYLHFVKIHTSVLSLFAYPLSFAIILLIQGKIDWQNSLIFFVASMIFDNMITGVNTTMDYIMAKDEDFKRRSVMTVEQISVKQAFTVIGVMVTIGTALGIWLVFRTNLMLLFLGGAIFLVFANYTSGPFPISRTPTGEFFSGTCQGLGIPFLFIFVNGNWDKLFALHIAGNWNFTISGNVLTFLTVVLACTPSWFLTSNVMLADNLSDRVADKANGRHTLPNVFGRKKASNLYRCLAYAGYAALVLGACLRLLPWLTLLTLLTIPIVHQKTEAFLAKPVKSETFVLALQNFQVVVGAEIVSLFLGYLLHF